MSINKEKYQQLLIELKGKADLVAVSKTKSIEDIQALYDLGQRDFGENYVQELVDKHEALPKDIRWHFIGHLQTNKVKYIAPFVFLIHGVDSEKLLLEINKQAKKINTVINCLLQVHIAEEETKFGFDENELTNLMDQIERNDPTKFKNVHITGLMGMASFSDDENKVKREFHKLHELYMKFKLLLPDFDTLSMGMSGDYRSAIEQGSTMVRIGSLLFGARSYNE